LINSIARKFRPRRFHKIDPRNATTLSREQRRQMEGDPLIYIVTVLIFYSCGIVILMINYMKKVRPMLYG
jgi:hypothetical protein